jgi:hypothetical protein
MKPFVYRLILPIMIVYSIDASSQGSGHPTQPAPLTVKSCSDFEPTGMGDNKEWSKAEWNDITPT